MRISKYIGLQCPSTVIMIKYSNLPKELDRSHPTWFTKLKISRIKKWKDRTHLFIEQHKFNSEIAADQIASTYEQKAQSKFRIVCSMVT